MRPIPFITLLFVALCLPGFSHGQTNKEIVSEAHALYHQASDDKDQDRAKNLYHQALLRYEQVYRNQPNPRLAYNIGNTYYRLGDLGRALVNYRRAEKELAGDTNLRHNLDLVRSERQDQLLSIDSRTPRLNLHRSLSLELRTQIFLGLYIAFWLAAALWYLKKNSLSAWIPGLLLLATLLVSTSIGLDKFKPPAKKGVIIAAEIEARQGDGRNYQAAFATPLHSATEFILIKKRGYWLHIELSDGRQCWIPARSAEIL